MNRVSQTEKRLAKFRLAVWFVAWLIAWFFLREEYPLAWQAAAFGTLFSLIWPLSRLPRPKFERRKLLREPEEIAPAPAEESEPSEFGGLARNIDVGMDLLVLTAFVDLSGGFSSLFSPLYFGVVYEAYLTLGPAVAVYAALTSALLSLIHLRLPITPGAAVLYGMAMGVLIIAAALVALRRKIGAFAEKAAEGAEEGEAPTESRRLRRSRAALMHEATIQELKQQIKDMDEAHRHLKFTYREVAHINREQKAQIEQLRAAQQLFETAATLFTEPEDASGYARLLRVAMNLLEAGGGVLWLRESAEDPFVVQAMEGRVAELVRAEPIAPEAGATPNALRALCEDRLIAASPAGVLLQYETFGETGESDQRPGGAPPRPAIAALLREPGAEGVEASGVIGVIGLCDPHGASRFSVADWERLQLLTTAFAAALRMAQSRQRLNRRLRETSLLYDLSRLVQSATDMDAVYQAVVEQAQRCIACENCTLFLLDRGRERLEARATRGRVVNLLDHIAFPRGQGVSGWVAGRGRQIVINDLALETNLLNVEQIPPRVRSFVAIPMIAQDSVVGVLNISHSQANAFTSEDVQLLAILAGQAAITIERTEAFHALESLAITDGLTKLFNHRFFQMRLDEELRRARRYDLASSLMIVDVDHFKEVNDQFGHQNGDLALQEIAKVLRDSVRDTEIVARYGGEEFALILPQTSGEQALIAAERLRLKIASHRFLLADGHPARLTVSVGVASFPQQGRTRAALIEQADRALYTAKNSGRNCVRLADGWPSLLAAGGLDAFASVGTQTPAEPPRPVGKG